MSAVTEANTSNNARGDAARRRRWRPARDAAWALLEPLVEAGSRVAIVGAGNGHDVPLRRLAARAAELALIDLDARALAAARRTIVRGRRRVATHVADVTGGAADAIVTAAAAHAPSPQAAPPPAPIAGGGYDLVVADLMLTQLLYPALRQTDLDGGHIDAILLRDGQPLVDAVVARLHASAKQNGAVVVLHDLLGWWDGHPQPTPLHEILTTREQHGIAAALKLARRGDVPYGCDPWLATTRAAARVERAELWRWPFAPGADYLVCGLVTRRSASRTIE